MLDHHNGHYATGTETGLAVAGGGVVPLLRLTIANHHHQPSHHGRHNILSGHVALEPKFLCDLIRTVVEMQPMHLSKLNADLRRLQQLLVYVGIAVPSFQIGRISI